VRKAKARREARSSPIRDTGALGEGEEAVTGWAIAGGGRQTDE
jgi:hypothetical protein